MGKQILFIGTPFMNIYQDIIDEMHRQGYQVDFIAEQVHPEDPDNVRGNNYESPEFFLAHNTRYWTELLSSEQYNKKYDILFVLDGQSIAPCVFSILRDRNENLYAVNYLFDTTKGVYRFDRNFQYFNKIATFDREESEKYSIDLLPIYWASACEKCEICYKFFGLGRYNLFRAQLFRSLVKYCKKNNVPYFLKLQGEKRKCYPINYIVKVLEGKRNFIPAPCDYYSDNYILKPVPLNEYRKLTAESEIIVDTNAPHQDGLTARFMWALGQGKKILTTNKAARLYDFYTPEQIYIVDDIKSFAKESSFAEFLNQDFCLDCEKMEIVDKYRLDNWVEYLLAR